MRRPRRAAPRIGAALVAAVVLALLGAAPASAHAYIVSSSPAPGTTVHRLERVSITFDEDLLDLGRNAIQVRGPGGRQVGTACATVDGTTLAAPVAAAASGTYHVLWRASSTDGHLVGGTYTFRYDGPATTPSPTTTPAPAPSCAPIGAAAAPRTPPRSSVLVVAIVVAAIALLGVLAVVVVAVVVLRRSGRAADQRGGGESPP